MAPKLISSNFDAFAFLPAAIICPTVFLVWESAVPLNSLHKRAILIWIELVMRQKITAYVLLHQILQVLKLIPRYLNLKGVNVTDEYIEGFKRAEFTFLHQVVFDPITRMRIHLTPIGER